MGHLTIVRSVAVFTWRHYLLLMSAFVHPLVCRATVIGVLPRKKHTNAHAWQAAVLT
jgi:hypothetical protein